MTIRLFVSETSVVDRNDAHRRVAEFAHLAEQWFGGPVTLVSNEIAVAVGRAELAVVVGRAELAVVVGRAEHAAGSTCVADGATL